MYVNIHTEVGDIINDARIPSIRPRWNKNESHGDLAFTSSNLTAEKPTATEMANGTEKIANKQLPTFYKRNLFRNWKSVIAVMVWTC